MFNSDKIKDICNRLDRGIPIDDETLTWLNRFLYFIADYDEEKRYEEGREKGYEECKYRAEGEIEDILDAYQDDLDQLVSALKAFRA